MKLKILATIFILLTISSISASAYTSQNTVFNDSKWKQINKDGFDGNRDNYAPRGITIFNGTLVIGTDNIIDFWTQFYTSMPIKDLIELYNKSANWKNLQSDGCEIWSYDDNVLKPIVGPGAVMKSGFGNKNNSEVGILISYKGYLYAGLFNAREGGQIWRTRDINETWELVARDGFEDKTNIAFWVAEIFNDYLYIGTINLKKGCEVFRTNDGVNWETVVGGTANTKGGFGNIQNFYAWSMCVYNNYLYVGTSDGGEIWKSIDGTNWKPVIAYKSWIEAKQHGADYPRGFNGIFLNNVGGVREMVVYNDEMYCGFLGKAWYDISLVSLPKIKLPGVGSNFLNPHGPPFGLSIWKYNSSTDKWTRVVGGIGKGNSSRGFGDILNTRAWSMTVYEGYIYVGTLWAEPINIILSVTRNGFLHPQIYAKISPPIGGGELWRFDGTEWQMINEKGFGNPNNLGIRALTVYKNCLIAVTVNPVTGCEMWSCNLSDG